MAYFVPNFVLIIFLQSILVHQVPPTQKNSKNCRKHPFDTLGTSFNQSGATIRGRKMQLSRRLMGGQGRRIFW